MSELPEIPCADDIEPGGDPVAAIVSKLKVADPKDVPADGDDRLVRPDGFVLPTMAEILEIRKLPSVSGLSAEHRAGVRQLIAEECHWLLGHQAQLHYTQDGVRRWEAIKGDWRYTQGKHQKNGDCSSTHTQLVRVGLRHYGVQKDLVNGEHWLWGYTGTIVAHGKPVQHVENLRIGDSILYGSSIFETEHVATSLGGRLVFSHGSDAGPFLLDLDYRPDRVAMRRHI